MTIPCLDEDGYDDGGGKNDTDKKMIHVVIFLM